jgi:hypothetical protein
MMLWVEETPLWLERWIKNDENRSSMTIISHHPSKLFAECYSLNVYVPTNSYVEILSRG